MVHFLVFLILLLVLLQRFSLNRDMTKLVIALDADKRIVEPGEEFNLILDIKNPDCFIYPYFSVDLNLPLGLEVLDGKDSFTSFLLPRQQLHMVIPCVIKKRGLRPFAVYTFIIGAFLLGRQVLGI